MPFNITLVERPLGYALEAATGVQGHPAKVAIREFTSSEDGDKFISRLEGWPTTIISQLPRHAGIRLSEIDHLVAVIKNDLTCTVYVNELPMIATVRATRPVESGQEVTEDDIGDFHRIDLGVPLLDDAGIVVVMSAGWRKGFFFDFGPINDEGPRQYNLPELLSSYFAYLHNQAVFRLSEDDWTYLIEQLWFPFVGLSKSILKTLVARAQSRDNLDLLVPKIRDHVLHRLPTFLQAWERRSLFAPHFPLLKHAAEEFAEGDFVSATAILYTRIEGLLREIQFSAAPSDGVTQKSMSQHVVAAGGAREPHSWLMPEMFRRYLEEAYFANFEPGQPAKLSRNAVGHGVAPAADFNEKAASVGLLVVEQIHWFLPSE